jgi:hypothetical protein
MSDEKGQDTSEDTGDHGFIRRWKADASGRPAFVYVVVALVVVTLTTLLAIIYFSASERERTSPPICTDINLDRAQQAVLRGEAERLTVVYDEGEHSPPSERYGPVLAKLDYVDATCSNLPQGVVNQEGVYTLAGVITFYNEHTDGQQVEITYQESARLDESLFVLPTTAATESPPTVAASVVTPEPDAGTPIVEASTSGTASPVASPVPVIFATPAT